MYARSKNRRMEAAGFGVRALPTPAESAQATREMEIREARIRAGLPVELQTQCAWCKAFKIENAWVKDAKAKPGIPISHGLCPDCAVKVKADNERLLGANS